MTGGGAVVVVGPAVVEVGAVFFFEVCPDPLLQAARTTTAQTASARSNSWCCRGQRVDAPTDVPISLSPQKYDPRSAPSPDTLPPEQANGKGITAQGRRAHRPPRPADVRDGDGVVQVPGSLVSGMHRDGASDGGRALADPVRGRLLPDQPTAVCARHVRCVGRLVHLGTDHPRPGPALRLSQVRPQL